MFKYDIKLQLNQRNLIKKGKSKRKCGETEVYTMMWLESVYISVGGVLLHMHVLAHSFVVFYFWNSTHKLVRNRAAVKWNGLTGWSLSVSPSLASIPPLQTLSKLA